MNMEIKKDNYYRSIIENIENNYITDIELEKKFFIFFNAITSSWNFMKNSIHFHIQRFGNVDVLQESFLLKQEALKNTLYHLNNKHKKNGGISFLLERNILSKEELIYKFKQEIQETDSIDEFLCKFGPNAIEEYFQLGILSEKEARKLGEIRNSLQLLNLDMERHFERINLKYDNDSLEKEIKLLEEEPAFISNILESKIWTALLAINFKLPINITENQKMNRLGELILVMIFTSIASELFKKILLNPYKRENLLKIDELKNKAFKSLPSIDVKLKHLEGVDRIANIYALQKTVLNKEFTQAKINIIQT